MNVREICESTESVIAGNGSVPQNALRRAVGLPEKRTETHACDCISRQAVIDTIETDCSWDIFNEWGARTPTGENIINAIKSVPSVEPEKCGDCISRQAVRNALLNKGQHSKRYKLCETWELNLMEIEETLGELPSVTPQPTTCDGCKHNGKFEDEVEYGYPSPCTVCKRRAKDNYER